MKIEISSEELDMLDTALTSHLNRLEMRDLMQQDINNIVLSKITNKYAELRRQLRNGRRTVLI